MSLDHTPASTRENVRFLVIGAGGIGCEVLKNLVLSGFRKISILDMDRIDVSNLNRQFLFTKKDVGLFKADTAAKAIKNYVRENDKLDITVYRQRVQDLPLEVFKSQDIVISALDNVEARKFVNNICVTCSLPLMEAGSTGKNGQGYALYSKAGTECFECRDQPKVTGYPVCTIRLTAEKPEHCVAWARYLFESIFAQRKAEAAVSDDDNALTDLADHILRLYTGESLGVNSEFAKKVAVYLFSELITSYLEVKNSENEDPSSEPEDKAKQPEPHKWLSTFEPSELNVHPSASNQAREILTKEYYAEQFMASLRNCLAKYQGQCVKFDKDEEDIMAFVASAANLRMMNFHIPMMSVWDLKTMAGAIQPAIASTNAIVAAIEVMNAIRLCPLLFDISEPLDLQRLNMAGMRFVWTRSEAADGRLLLSEKLDPAKSSCLVCSNVAAVISLKDFSQWPIKRFVKEVLEERLGGKDVTVMNAKTILYDIDLLEDCPEVGARLFEGKSELITISWLGLGACEMVVQENEEQLEDFQVVKELPEHAMTKDSWKSTKEISLEVMNSDDDEILVEGGKRLRTISLSDHHSSPEAKKSKHWIS